MESRHSLIFRLGKLPSTTTTKPRPLKLYLSDRKNVFDIFLTQKKYKFNSSWRDIRFSSDCTEQQKQYTSQFRQELFNRRSNREPDLIMKYMKLKWALQQ